MTLQLKLRGPKCWHLCSVYSLHRMLSCWQGTYLEYVWIQNTTDFPLPVLQRCTVGTLVLKQWTFWNEITTLPNSSSTQLLLLTLKRTSSQQLQKSADWEARFHRKWAAAVRCLFVGAITVMNIMKRGKCVCKSCTMTEERLDFHVMVHCSLNGYCHT